MSDDLFYSDEDDSADNSTNEATPRPHEDEEALSLAMESGGFVSYEDIAKELGPFNPTSPVVGQNEFS